ncbi:MAG: hypothetical protein OQJ99_10070 [Rhodospirillales bacterium]|nr:hypothetical protein [Rhodospirillales bacterium]
MREDDDNPTPDQRADVVVRRLENFIRENRTERGGISFQKWQDLARAEIAEAILEDEKNWREDRDITTRAMAIGAASVVTIGFWGVIATFREQAGLSEEALLMMAGGMILFATVGGYGIWKALKRHEANRRDDRLDRITSMDSKLRRIDRDVEKRLKELEKVLEEVIAMQKDFPKPEVRSLEDRLRAFQERKLDMDGRLGED